MSFRAVRNFGLITLSFIVVLVSVLSYIVMYQSAQKLEKVITIEETKLKRWQSIMEVITDAKDGLFLFYMEKSTTLEPVLVLIEKAYQEIAVMGISASDEEELEDIKHWETELRVFRQTVHAYSFEVKDGYKGGASAREMEDAALDAANRMILLNRSTADKIKSRILENNRSILDITAVSRKVLGIILIISVACSLLLSVLMNRALARPLNLLVEATRHVARGNLTEEIKVDSDDEIGELSSSFNIMVRNLRGQKTKMLEQKDYVDSIIANMAESLTVTSPEGIIKMVNQATCDLLGYQEEELTGQDVNILFTDDEDDREFPEVKRAESPSENDDYRNYELHYKTNDGRAIPVLFSSSALRDKSGTITGIICVAQDITQIREAERDLVSYSEKLEISNKELRHFLHVASHDLQEPLRKVSVFGDRLKDKFEEELGEKGRDYIDRMRRATARMQTLINDLLTFSRLTTRARSFETVDLSAIAREVKEELETNIEIGELPVLHADPVQMRQLFESIIDNSLKFRKKDEPPQVRISGILQVGNNGGNGIKGSAGKLWEITFEDNGIGFDPKYGERIFGVFQRLHGKNSYKGTGMGLSICRKIVERHGGTITAAGTPGEGTKIFVTLPLPHEGVNNG